MKKNKKARSIIMKKLTVIISMFVVISFSYANDKDEITKEKKKKDEMKKRWKNNHKAAILRD